MEQYILFVENRGKRIQRFIEWLKWRPVEDYKQFIKSLFMTQQASLADRLALSCKPILIIIINK